MRRTFVCAVLAVVASAGSFVFAAPEPDSFPSTKRILPARRLPEILRLEDDGAIERRLSRGDDHRYVLTLKSGECVRVIVEQRGINVIVQTRDAQGHVIADVNDEVRPRGEERIDFVAADAGSYTVAISAAPVDIVPGSYVIRLASRRMATESDRSMQEARRQRTVATALSAQGRFPEARALFERALAAAERLRGADDPDVGLLAFDLAGNAMEMRADARAEALLQRAIAIFDRAWGTDHPYGALARSRLALLYEHAGDGPKAEALLRQSMATIEKALGAEHFWYARCLTTQAILRFDAGDSATAEALDRRAIGILERIDNVDGIQYAALLNNLGEIYRTRGDSAKAEELFLRCLDAAERLQGAGSFRVSTSLQNLGIIARDRKEYAKALEYDTRALSLREQIVGPEHADIAPLLNNLGLVYHLTGDDTKALAAYSRALRIWENTVGPNHRGTLTAVGNIARTYASSGDVTNALAFERRAAAIIEKQLDLNLSAGSERQKLAFVRSMAERADRTISLHLRQAADNPEARSLAALVILQRKGRVQDAMADAFAAVRQRVANTDDRRLLDRLNETTARIARLTLNAPAQEGLQRSLAELEAVKDQLEVALSERSAQFRAQTQPVTLAAIEGVIPADAALIEFAVYRPFDPKVDRNADAYGPPHYAAYVIRRDGAPVGIDLGETAAIDRSIDALRTALRDPSRADVTAPARGLHDLVIAPLERMLADASRLIISPDGALNLVPFEALVDDRGRYLIERYAVGYVTSGRDLLRMQVARAAATPPVIVADPLFGEPAAGEDVEFPGTLAAAEQKRRSVTAGRDVSAMYFAPLAATGTEAHAIKALFPDSSLLTGARATKAMLQQVKAPRILHIASHGFFLDDRAPADSKPAGGNPLLRSGLAFAGANLTGDRQSNGILTALEASGLDLWGTKLVTLSACDTGVGEIHNGEGVYGLRRAFVLAGAETVVMSLWAVSDYVAREAMIGYYTNLRDGLGRSDALRQAKLAMLKRTNRRHPYYWAGFIQSGDWADLDGKR